MKKIDNIEQFDNLLKQQFDSFAPEPPAEVWQNLSQHPAIGNPSAASKLVSTVKSMSFVTKAIISLGVIVATAISVILIQEEKPKQAVGTEKSFSPNLIEENNIEKESNVSEGKSPISAFDVAPSPQKVKSDKQAVERRIADNLENSKESTSSNIEYQEPKTELKLPLTETHLPQSQVEKNVVHAPVNETNNVNEIENNTQVSKSNSTLDVDTSLVPEIPNTFTPGDDDNYNKEFVIKIDNESIYRLRVFDSKANLIFESFKKELRWNGQHFKSGENCESGKYFYIFDYQYKGAKELRQKSGYILLTR